MKTESLAREAIDLVWFSWWSIKLKNFPCSAIGIRKKQENPVKCQSSEIDVYLLEHLKLRKIKENQTETCQKKLFLCILHVGKKKHQVWWQLTRSICGSSYKSSAALLHCCTFGISWVTGLLQWALFWICTTENENMMFPEITSQTLRGKPEISKKKKKRKREKIMLKSKVKRLQ